MPCILIASFLRLITQPSIKICEKADLQILHMTSYIAAMLRNGAKSYLIYITIVNTIPNRLPSQIHSRGVLSKRIVDKVLSSILYEFSF